MLNRGEVFTQQRPLLFSIAYRMLGSVMDAEDMVQETFLRWLAATETVESPKAYLSTIITRLCIDQLRSAKVKREVYIGPWLPEPILSEQMPDLTAKVELADTISIAFLTMLESLSPVERAVFLLREVFVYDYAEIASMVEKSEANCRQMVRRAHQHLAEDRPRYVVSRQQQEQLTAQFLQACATGNMNALLGLLTSDIVSYSDGGGKVNAARKPLHGSAKVAHFLFSLLSKAPSNYSIRLGDLNGQPAILGFLGDTLFNAISFDFTDSQIQQMFLMVNPDKLNALRDG